MVLRQVLQLAVAVGHADRADVVALGEQQLDDHPPILASRSESVGHLHALGDAGDAGRQQPARAADLDQAEPAGADVGSPSRWQSVGMAMPCSRATSRIVSCPSARADVLCRRCVSVCTWPPVTARRCRGLLGCGADHRPAHSPRSLRCWISVLVAEVAQVLSTGFGAAWPRPHRLVRADHVAQLFEPLQVGRGRRAPRLIRVRSRCMLHGAGAAGDALAARLVHAELHEVPGDVHHAGRLVHDDHAAGAHDRARRWPATRSRPACRAASAGMQPPEGPPVCTALNVPPSGIAAADLLDDLAAA